MNKFPNCICGSYKAGGYGIGSLPPCLCDVKILDALIALHEEEGYSKRVSEFLANEVLKTVRKTVIKHRMEK